MNEEPRHTAAAAVPSVSAVLFSVLAFAVLAFSVLAFSGLSRPARAADLVLPPEPYPYVVVDQDIKTVLIEFGNNVKVPVEVGDQVKGRMRGQHSGGSAQDFLEGLCDTYGLVWYYDGSVIHISAKSEDRTELVDIGAVPMIQAIDKLKRLGVSDQRFPLRRTEDGVVSVSGPPSYRSLARQELLALAHRQPAEPVPDAVLVIRGGVTDPQPAGSSAGSRNNKR